MVFGDMAVSEHKVHYRATDEDKADILVGLGGEFEQFLAEQVQDMHWDDVEGVVVDK